MRATKARRGSPAARASVAARPQKYPPTRESTLLKAVIAVV
jgi:hypothetical protein